MTTSDIPETESGTQTQEPRPTAPPINSRFLFVDVASRRAKQLRRGAQARLEDDHVASMRMPPIKPERVAIEEVRRNLVLYDTPATTTTPE